MSYSLVIEGLEGGRRVRAGLLPRRGEWISLEIARRHWWLPVLEVAHALRAGEELRRPEAGSDIAHARSESFIYTTLALGVAADLRSSEDAYKLVLPPSRWPLGGRVEEEKEEEPPGQGDGRVPWRRNGSS